MYGTISRFTEQKELLSAEEFLRQYKEGVREFINIRMESEVVFRGTLLRRTSNPRVVGVMRKFDIEAIKDVSFRYCYFEKVVFSEVDLSGTKFEDCYLGDTSFECCGLDHVAFRQVHLSHVYFVGVVSYKDIEFDESSNISSATFARCLPLKKVFEDQYHEAMTIRYRQFRPGLYWLWKLSTDCGSKYWLLLLWSLLVVVVFATIFSLFPASFSFSPAKPSFAVCLLHSTSLFISLDNILNYGLDMFGKAVLLVEMMCSYMMLGLLASFFANIFPRRREL